MDFMRCYGCMKPLDAPRGICPHCGYDNREGPKAQQPHALPCGTVLNGRYVVGRVLGQGGFGITYIGWNVSLDMPVCIKEYYPDGAAMRSASQSRQVCWGVSDNARNLKQGRESFVREARKAVKLRDLDAVVMVWDVFYENETAYIVMDYIEGETLKSRLMRQGKAMGEKECVELLRPVMQDLEKAHARGIVHRDIKPDNIMLTPQETPVLLDLGAAKDLGGGSGQSSFVVASQGFSPLEQYTRAGEIGAWTDVYALCATIVWCVSGKLLPTPMDRLYGEPLKLDAFSPAVAEVLERGLALKSADRIQTMGELLKELEAATTPHTRRKKGKWPVLIAAMLVITLAGALILPRAMRAENIVKNAQVGDTVLFGTYEQDNDSSNGKEDIEWLVLAKEDDRILVTSKYALDCRRYNNAYESVTWESCTLRRWLNDAFLSTAFSADEQALIPTVTVSADKNPSHSTNPGNSTRDRVFLLSVPEAERYFASDAERQCTPTAYASSQGSISDKGMWWLRSPGYHAGYAACVSSDGAVYGRGNGVYDDHSVVRPALWIAAKPSAAETAEPTKEPAFTAPNEPAVGDTVLFGSYEQDNDKSNGKEDIEWLVLAKENDRILVTSKYALGRQQFNTKFEPVTWESCTLRKWLNNEFLKAAFSADEQALIPTVAVSVDKDPDSGTDPGASTQDQVFLLSIQEVNRYFASDEERKCYTSAQKTDDYAAKGAGQCWWWLRSPCDDSRNAAIVDYTGCVYENGYLVDSQDVVIRPALWISLSS